jgi:hypothetical protein
MTMYRSSKRHCCVPAPGDGHLTPKLYWDLTQVKYTERGCVCQEIFRPVILCVPLVMLSAAKHLHAHRARPPRMDSGWAARTSRIAVKAFLCRETQFFEQSRSLNLLFWSKAADGQVDGLCMLGEDSRQEIAALWRQFRENDAPVIR